MSLVVEQISKKYQDKAVLADVTVSFEPQKIYGLLGRNGARKSTLLNIINNRSFASAGPGLAGWQTAYGKRKGTESDLSHERRQSFSGKHESEEHFQNQCRFVRNL